MSRNQEIIGSLKGDKYLKNAIENCISMYKKRERIKKIESTSSRQIVAGPIQWFNPGINE